MPIKSGTYKVRASTDVDGRVKTMLVNKHRLDIERVVDEAKKLADDRKRALKTISDAALRRSAAR